jgi:hypothetical protein
MCPGIASQLLPYKLLREWETQDRKKGDYGKVRAKEGIVGRLII